MLDEKIIALLYHDFLQIKRMISSNKIKHRIMTELFSQNPFCWRVEGITPDALMALKENGWIRDGLKITRSHLFNRIDTHYEMLDRHMDIDEWWNFYWSRDYTILSLSSENKKISSINFIKIESELGLFRTSGFAWRHGKAEREFLQHLWSQNSFH